jgi:hypothetical protein
MFLTRIGSWGLHLSHVLLLGRNRREGGRRRKEARKHRTYSGVKCSIVECWFSVNVNCFVQCICTQISDTHEYCILILKLGYANPCLPSPSETKVTTLCKEQVQTCNNVVWLPMLLWHNFWTDWIELLLLISRPSLLWLVTHKEHNLTQLPLKVKNTKTTLK